MKKRDDIRSLVAAALIAYSVFALLSAQRKRADAEALRQSLQLEAEALEAQLEAERARLALPPSDELIERLARERLGLIRQGEIIFCFDG